MQLQFTYTSSYASSSFVQHNALSQRATTQQDFFPAISHKPKNAINMQAPTDHGQSMQRIAVKIDNI